MKTVCMTKILIVQARGVLFFKSYFKEETVLISNYHFFF